MKHMGPVRKKSKQGYGLFLGFDKCKWNATGPNQILTLSAPHFLCLLVRISSGATEVGESLSVPGWPRVQGRHRHPAAPWAILLMAGTPHMQLPGPKPREGQATLSPRHCSSCQFCRGSSSILLTESRLLSSNTIKDTTEKPPMFIPGSSQMFLPHLGQQVHSK